MLSSSEDSDHLAGANGGGNQQHGGAESDEDLPLMQRLEVSACYCWSAAAAAGGGVLQPAGLHGSGSGALFSWLARHNLS